MKDPVNRRSVLVTGASGFLGGHVAIALRNAGWNVLGTGRRDFAPAEGVAYSKADLTVTEDCQRITRGVDAVVHCAGLAHRFGKSPCDSEHHRVNAFATEQLIRSAVSQGVQQAIYVSSSSVYGTGQRGVDENTQPDPDTAYGRSKLMGEQAAEAVCEGSGCALTILRPATVYGIGDPGNTRRLIEAITKGRFAWIGRGANMKSMVSVEDVADAVRLLLAASSVSRSRVFNVSAPPLEMRSVVQAISEASGVEPNSFSAPGKPVLAVLNLGAAISAGRGPFPKLARTITKWLSDDTINASALEREIPDLRWRSHAAELKKETEWVQSLQDARAA